MRGAIDPRTAGTDTSFNHPACQRDSCRKWSHSSTSRESHRSAVPTRIAGGPSPRRRQARMQPTSPSAALPTPESSATYRVDAYQPAALTVSKPQPPCRYLRCSHHVPLLRMRLVGIIGYRLTVSLPTQPTSPKTGFSSSPSISAECSGPATASGCGAPPDTQIATSTSTT